jgi:hypothetical protein
MGADEFEVHGHEVHEIEHKAHSGDSLAGKIAVLTAILSTLGAVFAYQGAATENRAMLLKNEALLKKTEAANQWAYYQSKSQKEALAELATLMVPPADAGAYRDKATRYAAEIVKIQECARSLDAAAADLNAESEHVLHPHHRIAQGMTLIQIAIALASIAALTHKRWLVWGATAAAGIGIISGAIGWLM